jgi:2-desacetyl-2-hydroxyethyl bacteriochlorophyllide A dehydrogenase
VVIGGDRRLVVAEAEAADPGPGQVRVEVAYCGICGSDLHMRDRPEIYPAGAVMGHEFSGRIAALGPGVSDWRRGERVCVLPFGPCGTCGHCRAGAPQLCPTGGRDGVGLGRRPGAYAESVVVDVGMLFRLPDSVSDRDGALVEPVAVAVHAVARAGLSPPARTAVIGAGPIGLVTALTARALGYEPLLVLERNPERLAAAAALDLAAELADGELGAPVEERLGGAPEVVFECAGAPAALESAVDLVGAGGRVVLVGMALADPVRFWARPLIAREASIAGTIGYAPADFKRAIELIAAGAIPGERLITHVGPLEAAESLFGELSDPATSQMKVLLRP